MVDFLKYEKDLFSPDKDWNYLSQIYPPPEKLYSVSSTTRKARNIDKYRQKWYNISARKIAETRKKACTRGGVNV